MPYLTTYLFTDMPGVSAVYVSGAFAGALSTVSSNLSSMSNVFVNDFLYTWTSKKSEKFQIALRNEFQFLKISEENFWNKNFGILGSKILVVVIGGMAIGFAYLSKVLPSTILEAVLSIRSVVNYLNELPFSLADKLKASIWLVDNAIL